MEKRQNNRVPRTLLSRQQVTSLTELWSGGGTPFLPPSLPQNFDQNRGQPCRSVPDCVNDKRATDINLSRYPTDEVAISS